MLAKARFLTIFGDFLRKSSFLAKSGRFCQKRLARYAHSRSVQQHVRLWTSRTCLLHAACALRAHLARYARAHFAQICDFRKMAIFFENRDFHRKSAIFEVFDENLRFSPKMLARAARSRSTQQRARLWTSRAHLLCAASDSLCSSSHFRQNRQNAPKVAF